MDQELWGEAVSSFIRCTDTAEKRDNFQIQWLIFRSRNLVFIFFPPLMLARTNKRCDVSFQESSLLMSLDTIAPAVLISKHLWPELSGFLPPTPSHPSCHPLAVGVQPWCQAAAAQGPGGRLAPLHIPNAAPTCSSLCRGFAEKEVKQLCLMQGK